MMTRTLNCILGLLLAAAIVSANDESAAGDGSPASVGTTADALAVYRLGPGLIASVDDDGSIVIHVSDGHFSAPALTCTWPRSTDPRRKDPPEVFTTRAREGDAFGRRGFSGEADDDHDGREDEDRLDGRDNDGDRRIDEDYAAISNAMAVWNWRHGGQERHLETYHWSYPRLAGLMAAVFTARGSTPAPLEFVVPDAEWVKTDAFCFRHELSETGPAFVARVPDPRRAGHELWLGVAVLDAETRRLATERVRASGAELSVPLPGSTQAIALAAGPTRLRVVHDLAAVAEIRAGVVDPVSGQRMPWLPPALPPTPAESLLPAAELRPAATGDAYDLRLRYSSRPRLFCDPDQFRLDGEALPSPVRLSWVGDDGRELGFDWPLAGGLEDACHPYDQLDPAAPGTLVYRCEGVVPLTGYRLEGVLEDGRPISLPVTVTTPPVAEDPAAGATDASLTADDQQLELAASLLTNYPNPFRSSTQVSFRIPATAGEAFAWDGDGDPPFDPQLAMPFAGGGASVSVTVYDLEGRVIATLHDGILGVGQYQASWNGTDESGRTMASGAYFCKLQIENWSVTKRLVFIR